MYPLSLLGDGRANEWSGLLSQHTVWVREHNRIEDQLHELHPGWSGERLYQQTRRIVIAQWQVSVLKEYLPNIIGADAMRRYGLQLAATGHWNGQKLCP